MKRAKSGGQENHRWLGLPMWMLVPCALALFVIVLIPVAMTGVLSVLGVTASTLRQLMTAPFVGISNYLVAFDSQNALGVGAWQSLFVSVAFSLLTTVITTPIGFVAALTVHRRFRGQGLVRALYLLPYVLPMFVTALLARIVFLNQHGLVDRVLIALGGASHGTQWLLGSHAFWAFVLTNVWAQWPFIYLFTLAGLQSIPREQYEAAELDGASAWQKIRLVILPHVGNMLKLAILLSTLHHFGNFTLAYVMFSAHPPESVTVLPISTYFYAFTTFDYGLACALAVVMMLILLVPGYVYIRASRLAED